MKVVRSELVNDARTAVNEEKKTVILLVIVRALQNKKEKKAPELRENMGPLPPPPQTQPPHESCVNRLSGVSRNRLDIACLERGLKVFLALSLTGDAWSVHDKQRSTRDALGASLKKCVLL